MAKVDLGFEIMGRDEAQRNADAVTIVCTRTDTFARFALAKNPDYEWGECIETTMSPARHGDSESALSMWGWI